MNRGRGRAGGGGGGGGRGGGGGGGRGYWIPRGRSSRSGGGTSSHLHGHAHVGDDRQNDSDSFGNKSANFHRRRQTWEHKSPGSTSEKSGHELTDSSHKGVQQQAKNSPESVSSNTEELKCLVALSSVSIEPSSSSESGSKDRQLNGREIQIGGQTTGEGAGVFHGSLHKVTPQDDSQLLLKSGMDSRPSENDKSQYAQASPVISAGNRTPEHSEHSTIVAPFDIFVAKIESHVRQNPSLVKNREKRNELKPSMEGEKAIVLRSGMVLLKNYSFADQVGDDRQNDSDSFDNKSANFHRRRQALEHKSPGSTSEKAGHELTDSSHKVVQQQAKNSPESVSSNSEELKCLVALSSVSVEPSSSSESGSKDRQLDGREIQIGGQTTGEGAGDLHESLHKVTLQDESELLLKSGMNSRHSENDKSQFAQASPVIPAGKRNPEHSEHFTIVAPFDICLTKIGTHVMLKPSLLVKNREKRNEVKRSMEGEKASVLRSGMVLLKNYLSLADQVKIVKKCRDLGFGSGGFYQPGYRDGTKLHLKMMCLGKNWDPETSKYEEYRPMDGAKPPIIPDDFSQLVKRTIQDSHVIIRKDGKSSKVEEILPCMSPNICIVNFYSETGRLGLHKDRDESRESLAKGLPVVSFSIGDSAEFQYGDEHDVAKAEKITLQSGDVLIFGGKSRHIFHGVTAILPNTAPKTLLEETSLRPGRLNLTFRQS